MFRPARQGVRGFTLLELVVVVCIIATLMAVSVSYYERIQRDARVAGLATLSARFASVTAMLHLKWEAAGRPATLLLDGVTVQLNRQGWPVGARAPAIGKTLDACQQLWEGLFSNPGSLPNRLPGEDSSAQYWTHMPRQGICRYQLVSREGEAYYFDYRASDGRVTTFLNET